MTNATAAKARALVRPIAHRGLHDKSRGIIENTLSAFEAAIAKGYGIECDLRPARDLEPMVFHDDTLDRLTEGQGNVRGFPPAELERTAMKHTKDRIPRLSDLLDLVAGRVPVLIEIKSDWENGNSGIEAAFAEQIAARLKSYRGPFGLMSFDPRRIAPFVHLLPDAPVGLVAGGTRSDAGMPAWIKRWPAARLLDNAIMRPDFLAYWVRGLPSAATALSKRPKSMPLFTWTVRSDADQTMAARYADAMIFEGFEPVQP